MGGPDPATNLQRRVHTVVKAQFLPDLFFLTADHRPPTTDWTPASSMVWSPASRAFASTALISVLPTVVLFAVPFTPGKEPIPRAVHKALLGFASGGLLGDVFLHTIPHLLLEEEHDHGSHGSDAKAAGVGAHGSEMSLSGWDDIAALTMKEEAQDHSHDHHAHAHDSEHHREDSVAESHDHDHHSHHNHHYDCETTVDANARGHGSHDHSHAHGGGKDPHARSLKIGLHILGGFALFFLLEKIIRAQQGGECHAHSHGGPTTRAKAKKANGPGVSTGSGRGGGGSGGFLAALVPAGLGAGAYLNLAADSAHNFTDGLAIGASYAGGGGLGLATFLSVLAHELPHEVT